MPSVRDHIHTTDTFGQRTADAIATAMGSWTFIIAQTGIVALWMLLNTLAFIHHWDGFPYILLNLLFSTQAAYAAPIIMMSQNRQAQKDHLRDDHEADEVDLLFQINRQQLDILSLLRDRVAPPPTPEAAAQEKRVDEKVQATLADADRLEHQLGAS